METQTIILVLVGAILAFRFYDVIFGAYANELQHGNDSHPSGSSTTLTDETRRAILRKLLRGNTSLQQIAEEVHIPLSQLRKELGMELQVEARPNARKGS